MPNIKQRTFTTAHKYMQIEDVVNYLLDRSEATSGRLDEETLLVTSFEAACCDVIGGAHPNSAPYTMYSAGKAIIIDQLKKVSILEEEVSSLRQTVTLLSDQLDGG